VQVSGIRVCYEELNPRPARDAEIRAVLGKLEAKLNLRPAFGPPEREALLRQAFAKAAGVEALQGRQYADAVQAVSTEDFHQGSARDQLGGWQAQTDRAMARAAAAMREFNGEEVAALLRELGSLLK